MQLQIVWRQRRCECGVSKEPRIEQLRVAVQTGQRVQHERVLQSVLCDVLQERRRFGLGARSRAAVVDLAMLATRHARAPVGREVAIDIDASASDVLVLLRRQVFQRAVRVSHRLATAMMIQTPIALERIDIDDWNDVQRQCATLPQLFMCVNVTVVIVIVIIVVIVVCNVDEISRKSFDKINQRRQRCNVACIQHRND